MSRLVSALAIAGGLTLAGSAHAQSFNCRYARLPAEVAICQNADLRYLDESVATAYFSLVAQEAGVRQAALKRWQAAWLRKRNRCGFDRDCLFRAMQDQRYFLTTDTVNDKLDTVLPWTD